MFRLLCGHLPQNLGLNLTMLLYCTQKWRPVFLMVCLMLSANFILLLALRGGI